METNGNHRNRRGQAVETRGEDMAVLQLVSEEEIREDHLIEYFDDLYKIVCVGERPEGPTVRTTYIVDWEQLVHILEDYTCLDEDIVEVAPVGREEGQALRR